MRNKYKIESKAVNGEGEPSIKEFVISRPGKKVEFTLLEVEQHIEKLKKLKKECESTIELADAKSKNIEEHHKTVLLLTEQERFTAYLYEQIRLQTEPFREKLGEVNAQLKEYDEDIAEIKEQLPELADA